MTGTEFLIINWKAIFVFLKGNYKIMDTKFRIKLADVQLIICDS